MATRFKGEVASERLVLSTIKEDDQIQVRHEPGTLSDADKGVAKKILQAMPVAVCTSAAATGNKTATLQDSFPDFQLVNGRIVTVYFLNGNNQDTFTLNVAGTGAIPVVYEGLGSQNGLAGICAAGAFLNLKYVDITVSGTRIQRWLACETHNALTGLKTLLNPENIDGRDLNGVTTPGYYYGGFGNGCQNLPPDTVNCGEAWRGFTLIVISVIGNYAQICIPRSSSSGFMENHIAYRRLEDYVGYWSSWTWL